MTNTTNHPARPLLLGARNIPRQRALAQRGVTLVELMVGLAIGLMVIAVAMGALMFSRGISGTVSDASNIQQQAAYVMRLMGQQLRQAGSLYLDLGLADDGNGDAAAVSSFRLVGTDDNAIESDSGAMTVSYIGYKEPNFAGIDSSIARDCLGGPATFPSGETITSIENTFQLSGTQLRCNNQPIAEKIANFQVRYLKQDQSASGNPSIEYVAAAAINEGEWGRVQGVEICLVLYGTEAIEMPADGSSTYRDCDDSAIDMAALTGDRARRMHIRFRNVFQLRSQGLIAGGF